MNYTPSSHRRRPNRGSRLTPGPVAAGAQVRRASARITNGLLLCCFRPAFPPVATVPRHKVSTVQVCCLRPIFPYVTHWAAGSGRPQCHGTRCRLCRCAASGPSSLLSLTGPGLGRPQCHGTRCRLCRCAASGPSSLLSLTGPWGWVAHKCRDCWSPASGPLSPCPPPGPAGVIVTSTRIRTSGADVQ